MAYSMFYSVIILLTDKAMFPFFLKIVILPLFFLFPRMAVFILLILLIHSLSEYSINTISLLQQSIVLGTVP